MTLVIPYLLILAHFNFSFSLYNTVHVVFFSSHTAVIVPYILWRGDTKLSLGSALSFTFLSAN